VPRSRPRPGPPPDGDDALAELERALTRLLRQMTRPAFYRWLAAAGGVHLERADYGVLVRIDEAAPVRMTDLAESLGVDISTVSRNVRGLERAGLVCRTGDPADQRASRLSLSDEGQDVLRRVRRTRQEAMRNLLADWTDTDRALLARLVARLSDDMDGLGQAVASPADVRAAVPATASGGGS
jgi:DNA-binding MarR family transcriptional regulator